MLPQYLTRTFWTYAVAALSAAALATTYLADTVAGAVASGALAACSACCGRSVARARLTRPLWRRSRRRRS